MSLYPFFAPRSVYSPVHHLLREVSELERQIEPLFHGLCQNEVFKCDNEKFSVNLNVSDYKPEELKIDLDGRKLKIEGNQKVENEHGFSKRSFSRIVLLPEDADLAAITSNLTEDGQLSIEAPRVPKDTGRSIPINVNPAVKDTPKENTK
ncbi:unnamed protein product [Caenorhabditis bovis]|uniref:SHSP domain-containing protein n=1 Tax=Caenorhabditis bovis TaxID=2654633 RepID=A0A8S1FFM0_9PELO|nr:unnamed protein product [Caenorhabditis bovis]